MTGLNKFTDKDRRRQRRQFQRNVIARDLHQPKYRQKIIADKRKEDEEINYEEDE